jgi:hypothetical protein
MKLASNVNIYIVKKNLKSENSQDYAQKPQRNCMIMNLAFGSIINGRGLFAELQL